METVLFYFSDHQCRRGVRVLSVSSVQPDTETLQEQNVDRCTVSFCTCTGGSGIFLCPLLTEPLVYEAPETPENISVHYPWMYQWHSPVEPGSICCFCVLLKFLWRCHEEYDHLFVGVLIAWWFCPCTGPWMLRLLSCASWLIPSQSQITVCLTSSLALLSSHSLNG